MNEKKIALITGANKGIGFETARQFAQTGYAVLLGARDEEHGKRAEAELRAENLDARFLHLDVERAETHETARKFIEETLGKLDVLVNNAAIVVDEHRDGTFVQAGETPLEVYRKTFETNFFGVIALTQTLLPLIKRSDAGRIVNLSSLLASLTLHSDPNSEFYHYKIPAYDISKTALNAFTVHLAYDLRDTAIKVNAADPGYVATDMNNYQGVLTVEEGAKTSVALATLPDDGETGKYFHLGEKLPW